MAVTGIGLGQAATKPKRRVPKNLIASGGIFLGVLVYFLTQTRLPNVISKLSVVDEAVTDPTRSTFSQVLDPEAMPWVFRWIAYGVNLWDGNAIGMFFAMLLAGAAMTMVSFVPKAKMARLLGRRGRLGSVFGAGFGVPLFMCSACSAPVSLGVYRGGAALESSLGVIVGSALFHPIALFAIFTLMPADMALARVGFALAMLLVAVPTIARRLRPTQSPPLVVSSVADEVVYPGATACAIDEPDPEPESWVAAGSESLRRWGRNTLDFAFSFGPPMLIASFAVGVVFSIVSPQRLAELSEWGLIAIVVAALVGTIIQVPGMFEVPLVLGVLAVGLSPGAATALLVTIPSAGLITFTLTRKEFGWQIPAALLSSTLVLGVVAGVLVEAL